MPHLFEPYTLRGLTLRNRIGVSPMCQYSSDDGFATDWHLVHLGSRAVGGAGVVILEATAVEARGRISPQDLGIYKDEHIEKLAEIAAFIKSEGAVPGMQLAHAGRKASTHRPWDEQQGEVPASEGGWQTVAPSAVRFSDNYPLPTELTIAEIKAIQDAFRVAARRAVLAGYEWIELHGAHGYLMHQFLSPIANKRIDQYGGSFENRIRFVVETCQAVRDELPQHLPLTLRISATDWAELDVESWTADQSVELAKRLKAEAGVELIDVSTGGMLPHAKIPVGSGYQVPFSEQVRSGAQIATAAVGQIVDPAQADEIVRNGRADIVLLARELLRDAYWPLHAAKALRQNDALKQTLPDQYARAF